MSTTGDVSITATEATVAGSSVAVTEAEEDAASYNQPLSAAAMGGTVILTKKDSLDISVGLSTGDDDDDDDDGGDDVDDGVDEQGEEEGEYTAPMHLHALRTPAKLKGARSRSSSRSRPGSRRNSASPPRGKVGGGGELTIGGMMTISPSVSVESSLDGISHGSAGGEVIDPDILLDKLGFRDLDPNVTQEELQELLRRHISSNNSLPTLNERMSEETMDDVHAFTDLQFVAKKSKDELEVDNGDNSPDKRPSLKAGQGVDMGSTASLLNTLVEGEDEDAEDLGASSEYLFDKIPDGISKSSSRKKRDTMNSTMAVGMASASSFDDDEDDAEVDISTSVFEELKISDGRRLLKQSVSSMAVTGSKPDFLEDDEQDGLEADLDDR